MSRASPLARANSNRRVRSVNVVAGFAQQIDIDAGAVRLQVPRCEHQRALKNEPLLLFCALAAAAAVVYAQMHRDSILSRITGTVPGKLGGDFWLRLASVAGLTLLGLLAYQFPQVSNLLFSWIEPALQALK